MIEQELKKVWNSSNDEKIKLDMSRLIIDINRSIHLMKTRVYHRDRREIIGCIAGIFGFTVMALTIPFPVTQVACILTIIWFAYVIYRLKSIKPLNQPDASLPFTDQLESRKVYLKKQAKLLDSVLYWYVLPHFIFNIIFIMGLGDPVSSSLLTDLLPTELREKVISIAVLAIFYGYIFWLNRRAVKENWEPLIRNVEKVQQQLAD